MRRYGYSSWKRAWCWIVGHRHKFDTYPRRGMCIRCGADMKVTQ